MKQEQKQLLDFMLKVIILLGFAALYAIGGSSDFWGGQLWIRRWLASFLLSVAGFFLSGRDWKYAVAFPLIGGAMTLPYGAEDLAGKVWLRTAYGVALGLSFNLPNILNKEWVLAMYGLFVGTVTSIILGVFNPTPNAIVEQASIAFVLGFTYIIGIKNKEEKTI